MEGKKEKSGSNGRIKGSKRVQGRVSLSNLYLANSAIHYLDSEDLCETMIAFVPVH